MRLSRLIGQNNVISLKNCSSVQQLHIKQMLKNPAVRSHAELLFKNGKWKNASELTILFCAHRVMSWTVIKLFLSVPGDWSDEFALFVWQTCPTLTRLSVCLPLVGARSCFPFIPPPTKVSKSLYPLLISPQASIFVPHFISFTLSLSLHLSPLSPVPVVMLSVGPGRIPRSTVSVVLRGWGLKRKDSFLSTSHRA